MVCLATRPHQSHCIRTDIAGLLRLLRNTDLLGNLGLQDGLRRTMGQIPTRGGPWTRIDYATKSGPNSLTSCRSNDQLQFVDYDLLPVRVCGDHGDHFGWVFVG